MKKEKRNKIYYRLGGGMIIAFIILRILNFYGDPNAWVFSSNPFKTVLSFINLEKYPPSLLYILITLGPAIISLPLLEKVQGGIKNFFVMFGRVPMFYYILHIPAAHLLAVLTALILGISPAFLFSNQPPWLWPSEWGFDLAIVYLFWAAVILLLYPLMKWFAGVKERNKTNKWLSYL